MNPRSIRDYADTIHPHYLAASRSEKSRILAEFCRVTGYHRKSAIRLLHHAPPPRRRSPRAGASRTSSAPRPRRCARTSRSAPSASGPTSALAPCRRISCSTAGREHLGRASTSPGSSRSMWRRAGRVSGDLGPMAWRGSARPSTRSANASPSRCVSSTLTTATSSWITSSCPGAAGRHPPHPRSPLWEKRPGPSSAARAITSGRRVTSLSQ